MDPIYPMGRRLGTLDPTTSWVSGYGAVNPTTQWAGGQVLWILLPDKSADMVPWILLPNRPADRFRGSYTTQAGEQVPWILLPDGQADWCHGSYHPMGRRIDAMDTILLNVQADRYHGSYYPMCRRIGVVDPTAQWAGLCLRNGMHQRWTFRNNLGHHPLWDILSWVLSKFGTFSYGTFCHVYFRCWDILQPLQQIHCLQVTTSVPPPPPRQTLSMEVCWRKELEDMNVLWNSIVF